jgi:hypothetical protein
MQVHQKLYSREWKARVYAGEALAELASRVEHYSAKTLDPECPTPTARKANAISNFSLDTVLASGAPLVSSGNQVRCRRSLSWHDATASQTRLDQTHTHATVVR